MDSTRRSLVAHRAGWFAASFAVAGLLGLAAPGAAVVTPQHLPLQGWVMDAGGQAVTEGAVSVRIYAQAAGGDSVYAETFAAGVLDGTLDVLVGAGGAMLLDADSLYHLEIAVDGDEVVGDAAAGRLPFRPGAGSHARPDLEARLAALEAEVGGWAERLPPPVEPAAVSRKAQTASRLDGPQLASYQLGVGIARGASSGYQLDADMLLQPCGLFGTAAHSLKLGPWYLARARAPVDAADAAPPGRLRLGPCMPNPFRANTVIRFGLPSAVVTRLAIYDLAGRRVRNLVDGRLVAGWHRAEWDGRSDAGRPMLSGVFFCRLEAAGASEITRLTLVR